MELTKQNLKEIEFVLTLMIEDIKKFNTEPNFFDNKYVAAFKSKLRELLDIAQNLLDSPEKSWSKKHNKITMILLEYAELCQEYYGEDIETC
jgi:hypothetical protein